MSFAFDFQVLGTTYTNTTLENKKRKADVEKGKKTDNKR